MIVEVKGRVTESLSVIVYKFINTVSPKVRKESTMKEFPNLSLSFPPTR